MAYLADHGTVETDRLILRPPTPSDVDALASLFGDAEVMRLYGPGTTRDRSWVVAAIAEIGRHYERYGFGAQVMIVKSTGRITGLTGLQHAVNSASVQIGWIVERGSWRQGFAEEAGRALLDYGFAELGLERIEANTVSSNEAAMALIAKIGMSPEGVVQFDGLDWARFAATPQSKGSRQ